MSTPDYWQQGCKHLVAADSTIAQIINLYQGEKLASRGDAFTTLVRSIIGQQISVIAAASVMNKLLDIISELTPHAMLQKNEEELHKAGLSRSKSRYCLEVAKLCANPPDWHNTPHDKLQKILLGVPGIGPWTWQMFAIFYLQLPDEFPAGDLGLQNAIVKAYKLKDREQIGSNKMKKVIADWQPYRTIATWYLWRSLDPEPVAY